MDGDEVEQGNFAFNIIFTHFISFSYSFAYPGVHGMDGKWR